MNRPRFDLEEPLEPRPCVVDRVLERMGSGWQELRNVRWTHVVPFAFVAFVVGVLVGMMADLDIFGKVGGK